MLHTPGKARKLFTALTLSALGLLVLAGAGSSAVPSASGLLPEQAVAPTAQERSLAPRVASILEQNHYRHILIDERLSPLVLDIFRDGQRRYGAREFSPNIIRRLEDACQVRVLGQGFPAQITDDEPEERGYEVVARRADSPA